MKTFQELIEEIITEISLEKIKKVRDRGADRVALSFGKTVKDPETGLKTLIPPSDKDMDLAKKGMKSFMNANRAITRKTSPSKPVYKPSYRDMNK